ncbi:MAG: DNA-processing protein DprA, partial [Fusobacteria bacterium]|nr:DNA-processing protein DprA [Fusobacteriota bacterium]
QKEISRDGLVISQYAPSAPGKRWQFPIRGITLSGISQFTVIVDKNYLEGDYKLIEYSLKHGRVVFMPLPAKITLNNRWLEKYINRKGIVLYRDFDDFVRQINIILS